MVNDKSDGEGGVEIKVTVDWKVKEVKAGCWVWMLRSSRYLGWWR